MPIMHSCSEPRQFNRILVLAIVTLLFAFLFFGTIGYITYGSNMDKQVITEMLPAGSIVVILVKLAYTFNVIVSYVLFINPVNVILENCLFNRTMPKSTKRHWLKNLSRFLVCASAAVFAFALAEQLDVFIASIGAVFCSPLALTIPAALHWKVMARTGCERLVDLLLIVVSLGTLIFCVTQTLLPQ